MKIDEYRIMYNLYDGKGDIEYTIVNDLVTAIEVRFNLEEWLTVPTGKAWIERREVSTWQKIEVR